MHRKKFNEYEILVRLKKDDNMKNIYNAKWINLQYDFEMGMPLLATNKFASELDKVVDTFEEGVNYEVEIIFVSDLGKITYIPFLDQPKPILTRKLFRLYQENRIKEIYKRNWERDCILMRHGECDKV